MAARILEATGHEATLVRGGRGVFDVKVDGRVVACKSTTGFPEDDDCVQAVKAAL